MNMNKSVTILCGGIGLGEYNPGLVMASRLRSMGIPTDILVLESLYYEDKRLKIHETKIAFQKNYKIARMAVRLMKDIIEVLDNALIQDLFKKWKTEERQYFVVFSGFWVPVLEQYLSVCSNQNISIDLFHVSANDGASWKKSNIVHPWCRHLYLCDLNKRIILHNIKIIGEIIPFKQRSNRIVIHGGGWGIGNYLEKIPELSTCGTNLDIVVNNVCEVPAVRASNKYYMNDPMWRPWDRDKTGQLYFTPFGEVLNDGSIDYQSNPDSHEIYKLIRQNRAVVCKTGGASLIDSISSATPIIMLDPYNSEEQQMTQLWEYLEFGIRFDKWINSTCPMDIMEKLHNNLLAAQPGIIDYVEEYVSCKQQM